LAAKGDALLGLPNFGNLGFQTPATPIMDGLVDLHHDIMVFLVFIIVFVLYMMIVIVFNFHENSGNKYRNTSNTSHHTILEIV